MTALLAGSRLAAHTLQLTEGSTSTLGQLFPAVEHIARFNLRSDAARAFLLNADHHVASVAVPYALATHEDFVFGTLDILADTGRVLLTHGKPIKAWNMHSILFETCGENEPDEWMQSFHVLRELRNCITHDGGLVSERLRAAINDMGVQARTGWQELNDGQLPEAMEEHGRLRLTAQHIFSAFAVTKQLGRVINSVIGTELNEDEWAHVIVLDFGSATRKTRNSSNWRRSLVGYARNYYAKLEVAESALEAASRDVGLWTRPSWSE